MERVTEVALFYWRFENAARPGHVPCICEQGSPGNVPGGSSFITVWFFVHNSFIYPLSMNQV